MAAVTGDLIRITDKQTYLGQECLNVYFYRIGDVTALVGDYLAILGGWFRDNVMGRVINIQAAGVSHTGLFLENLSNGVDIETFTDDFPVSGQMGDAAGMPPFVSFGFEMLRESRVTRNGYKRYVGVCETQVTDGIFVGDESDIALIETALGSDIHIGLVTEAAPVIVKHPVIVPAGTYLYSDISAGVFKGIGTQNTRKFGRGV